MYCSSKRVYYYKKDTYSNVPCNVKDMKSKQIKLMSLNTILKNVMYQTLPSSTGRQSNKIGQDSFMAHRQ